MSAYITEMKVVAQKVGRGCGLLCPQVPSQVACSPPFQCCSSLCFLYVDSPRELSSCCPPQSCLLSLTGHKVEI